MILLIHRMFNPLARLHADKPETEGDRPNPDLYYVYAHMSCEVDQRAEGLDIYGLVNAQLEPYPHKT